MQEHFYTTLGGQLIFQSARAMNRSGVVSRALFLSSRAGRLTAAAELLALCRGLCLCFGKAR